jgi:hypothetical protein
MRKVISFAMAIVLALAVIIFISARSEAAVGTYTLVIGDSIANYGKDNLLAYRPTWKIDAINGSSPATLSSRITSNVTKYGGKHPANIVVELGTNYSSTFQPEDYRIVRTKLPDTRIIFVTPGRDPFVVGQESARRAAAYAYYMIRLANADPRACIVPWAEAVDSNPGLLYDGVHGTPDGEERWAREVFKGVDACVATEQ